MQFYGVGGEKARVGENVLSLAILSLALLSATLPLTSPAFCLPGIFLSEHQPQLQPLDGAYVHLFALVDALGAYVKDAL